MTQAAPASSGVNADQVDYWNTSAGETWAALQESLDRQIEPLGRLAMDALTPRPGERAIDVGCGCGATTLAMAARVGASGSVLGVDVSGPMLAVARRRARHEGAAPIRFIEADAQTHDFEAGGAEVVFSRFGVMFFADPAAAFANLRKALAPGGRLGFVCWRAMELNPFMTLPLAAALTHLPRAPAPPEPGAPGPFAFADEGRVRDILGRAGFADIALEPHDEAIGCGDIDETVKVALGIGPLGRILREEPHLKPVVEASVRAAVTPHATRRGVLLPSAAWIVTAENPGTGMTG